MWPTTRSTAHWSFRQATNKKVWAIGYCRGEPTSLFNSGFGVWNIFPGLRSILKDDSILAIPETFGQDRSAPFGRCSERLLDLWDLIAPLADLETSFSTPTNQGVQSTAPAGEVIYVHLLRLGGSGRGQIATVNSPIVAFKDGAPEDESRNG